jgi:hypothetical protein
MQGSAKSGTQTTEHKTKHRLFVSIQNAAEKLASVLDFGWRSASSAAITGCLSMRL